MSRFFQIDTVEALRALPSGELETGDCAFVAGYARAGDGGEKTVYFDADSDAAEDGGLVHAPADGGRGRWLYRGHAGDFALFGIFDDSVDADAAYHAMVNNPRITLIRANSDLNFARRHTDFRNNLTLDFQNHAVHTRHAERSRCSDPFAATFAFRGYPTGEEKILTLPVAWRELQDIYYVGDSSWFSVGDWVQVSCNRLSGWCEMELDKMLEVTEIIDETRVRFNYKNGWAFEPGRIITFRKIRPVHNITIRNLRFFATPGGERTGTSPIAFEYAVRCDIDHIYSQENFWPLCIRRYNTHFLVEACELVNPCEVVIGGTGYLAQNLNSLYGCVRDCHVSNARHLNDFTASAYCMVENCHGDGDWCGAYVTHGQYEHDLTYVGNSGLLSFANSGPTWGCSAKRITVMRHSCSRLVAWTKITDLTLIDVQVNYREEKKDYRYEAFEFDSGTIFLNADGAQLRGCTAEGGIKFIHRSARSRRRNIMDGCAINQPQGYGWKIDENGPDIPRIDFVNCDFYGCAADQVQGVAEKNFINTEFHEENW